MCRREILSTFNRSTNEIDREGGPHGDYGQGDRLRKDGFGRIRGALIREPVWSNGFPDARLVDYLEILEASGLVDGGADQSRR